MRLRRTLALAWGSVNAAAGGLVLWGPKARGPVPRLRWPRFPKAGTGLLVKLRIYLASNRVGVLLLMAP